MVQELQNFRAKFPQYGDMDDATLAARLAAKYPDAYGDLPGKVTATVTAPKEEPGLGSRIWSGLGQRGEAIIGEVTKPEMRSVSGFLHEAPEAALRTVGHTAGSAFDIMTELGKEFLVKPTKQLYDSLPQSDKSTLKSVVSDVVGSPIGQMGLTAAKAGAGWWENFKQSYPNAAKDLEAIFNISAVYGPARAAAKGVISAGEAVVPMAKETAKAAGRAAAAVKGAVTPAKIPPTIQAVQQAIDLESTYGMQKGIGPGVLKVSTGKKATKYSKSFGTVVEDIIENENQLNLVDYTTGEKLTSLPKRPTVAQVRDVVDQRKRNIAKEFTTLAKSAGQDGAIVSNTNLVRELISMRKAIELKASPAALERIDQLLKAYGNVSTMTPEEAQNIIQVLNQRTRAFHAKPDYDKATSAWVDEVAANILRADTDAAITNLKGPGWQELRNKWGAYKEVERDISRRAALVARKYEKGLIDMSDIFTGGEAVRGIISMDPASIAKAAVGKGIAKYQKWLNSPDRIIGKMFENVRPLMARKNELLRQAGITRAGTTEGPIVGGKLGWRGYYGQSPSQIPWIPAVTPEGNIVPRGPLVEPMEMLESGTPGTVSGVATATGQAARPGATAPDITVPPRAPVIVQRPGTMPESAKVGAPLKTPATPTGKATMPQKPEEFFSMYPGALAGVETDENGNQTFNVGKAVAGMVAAGVGAKLVNKMVKAYHGRVSPVEIQRVVNSTKDATFTSGRPLQGKVLVTDAYETWKRMNPESGLTLEQFKQALLDLHRKGQATLSRSDMHVIGGKTSDPSTIRHLNAEWQLIRKTSGAK